METVKRILTYRLIAVAAIVLLFEEWLWHRLIKFGDRLARLPLVGRLEAWIATLPPDGALAFFLVPVFTLFPVKICALFLIAHGHGFLGIATIAFAKVLGTAWAARIYHVTSPQLMKIRWFARFHTWFLGKKDLLLGWLRAQSPWRAAQTMVRRTRHLIGHRGRESADAGAPRPGISRRWGAAAGNQPTLGRRAAKLTRPVLFDASLELRQTPL